MENSDVVGAPLINSLIYAYGYAGNLGKMRELFLGMKEKDCRPDGVTFATMIQAYNAHGMVEAAET